MGAWTEMMFLAVMSLSSGMAIGHGGGLNVEGCHNNRKTGDYHCHRAPSTVVPPAIAPQATATPRAAKATSPEAPRPPVPTCHVGPRGGTYTITSTGRKNYGGC
jgi:hypothetical protein